MNWIKTFISLIVLTSMIIACSQKTEQKKEIVIKPHTPIVDHIYTADPSAHVFEDKLYIYPSHDIENDEEPDNDGSQYAMEDYHVLSIEDFSTPAEDHGEVLHVDDIPWAKRQLWAPDAAYKDGTYYFYFPAKDEQDLFRIGVATSDSPAGPFTPEENYIPGSYSMDPSVFIDDDDRAYMYIGGIWGGQLEKWQNGTYDPEATEPTVTMPALGPVVAEMEKDMLTFKDEPVEVEIVYENGNPILAGDEDKRFFEGAWMHKYNEKYYLSYSTGTTHKIVYAVGDSPTGPFVFQGDILEPVEGWTTHHSIVEYNDKWYLFYHDASLSEGVDYLRSIKYAELTYNDDGTIQTINPYEDE